MDELSERDLILGTVMETLYAGGPRSDGIHYFEDGVLKRSWEHWTIAHGEHELEMWLFSEAMHMTIFEAGKATPIVFYDVAACAFTRVGGERGKLTAALLPAMKKAAAEHPESLLAHELEYFAL